MEEDLLIQYLQPKSTWTPSMESKLVGTITTTMIYSEQLNQYVIDQYQANYFDNNEVSNETETPIIEEIEEEDSLASTKADSYYEEQVITEDGARSLLSDKISSWGVVQMSNGEQEYQGKLCWCFDVSEKEGTRLSQFYVDQNTGQIYDDFGNEL